MNNVEIFGIPYAAGENLVSWLHAICNKDGLPLDEQDIGGMVREKQLEANDKSGSSEIGRPHSHAIVVKFTR